MKYRMLDLLCCSTCGKDLQFVSFKETENDLKNNNKLTGLPHCKTYCGLNNRSLLNCRSKEKIECDVCFRKEIVEGLLACKCGSVFPIIDRIPRFVENNLSVYPKFRKKYRRQIKSITNLKDNQSEKRHFNTNRESDLIHISFSEEWNMFDHDRDRAWGWDLDNRLESVLNDFKLDKELIKGKLLFDAGCGIGALTAKLSALDIEVVGFDLSEGVTKAELNKNKIAKDKSHYVHFVQGNLFYPPFKKKSFDFVYSYGVLHHTPDTKKTFCKLTPLVKKGGRLFIWVYGKRNPIVALFMWHGRWLRDHIPLKWLSNYCRFLSPFYKIVTDILSFLKISEYRKRTTREITIDLFDMFSPKWNHTHSESEICHWFEEQQFININVSGIKKQGPGAYGDKA